MRLLAAGLHGALACIPSPHNKKTTTHPNPAHPPGSAAEAASGRIARRPSAPGRRVQACGDDYPPRATFGWWPRTQEAAPWGCNARADLQRGTQERARRCRRQRRRFFCSPPLAGPGSSLPQTARNSRNLGSRPRVPRRRQRALAGLSPASAEHGCIRNNTRDTRFGAAPWQGGTAQAQPPCSFCV